MSSHAANYRGILAMIGGSAFFSCNDAGTKFAAQYLPVTEIVTVRACFALVIALAIIFWRREIAAIATMRDPYLLLRATIEAFIGILVVYCLSIMPIANFTAIILVQPFIMTAVGAIWLGERVGWRRWTAVVVGFVGMLLVVKPGTDAFQAVSLIALLAAALSLTRDLLVRKIHGDVPTSVIVFSTALFAVPIGVLGSGFQPWTVPGALPTFVILLSAAFLVAAFALTVLSFRGTDVSVVAPFRYSIVVFAFVLGIIVFAEIPDALSLIGIGLIVAAGLYMLHRETVRRKSAAATAQ